MRGCATTDREVAETDTQCNDGACSIVLQLVAGHSADKQAMPHFTPHGGQGSAFREFRKAPFFKS